jgi:hypothetical protein
MASSDGPEEEFRDETRKTLLSSLEQRIGLTVPPTTWACLWLADIEKLEGWLYQITHERISGTTRNELIYFDTNLKVIAKCTVKTLHMSL